MKMTIEEMKKTPTYRWLKELSIAYHKAGVIGEPVEIALKAIIDAPYPDYLPVAGAVKVKFMFMYSIYANGGTFGAMSDAMPGVMNMMTLASEEIQK